jgi:hypothetical protein
MVFFETALESKTLAALGKSGLFSSLVNKFNADPELLDDLVSVDLTFCRMYLIFPGVE